MSFYNASVKQVLSLKLRGGRSYLKYLLQHNHQSLASEEPGRSMVLPWSRPHHQLPCSERTRLQRVDLIASLVAKNAPICLLGDDDAVGLALVRQGFLDVTVYDCDEHLLQRLRAELQGSEGQHLQLIHADVRHIASLRPHFAQLVAFDPPYHHEGLAAFARAALYCVRRDQAHRILCMTVPQLFANSRKDWFRFTSLFSSQGLKMTQHLVGFNRYPIGRASQWFLRFMVGLLLGQIRPLWGKHLYFYSDCTVWEGEKA